MKLVDRLWGHIISLGLASVYIGVVVGAVFTDGTSTIREWIGALSGWVAAAAALFVGITQIKPLLKQTEAATAAEVRVTLDELTTINQALKTNLDEIEKVVKPLYDPKQFLKESSITDEDNDFLGNELYDKCVALRKVCFELETQLYSLKIPPKYYREFTSLSVGIRLQLPPLKKSADTLLANQHNFVSAFEKVRLAENELRTISLANQAFFAWQNDKPALLCFNSVKICWQALHNQTKHFQRFVENAIITEVDN